MTPASARWTVPVLALALIALGGCSAETATDSARRGTERVAGPSALDDMDDAAFPAPLIDTDDVLSGGPPPDGIPPIDEPTFEEVGEVDWLAEDEPVLSLTVGEETRAYPVRIMTWHEIVNDTVGETPVAVTYCPLCNSGVAFDRRVEGEPTTFGTSGRLYADNLVMYDRRTESLWPQLTGRASIGVLTGTTLDSIPMGTVGWDQFRTEHPDALVLSRDTGFDRAYGTNPYEGYDDPTGDLLFELPDGADGRLGVKTRVVGVAVGDEAVAVPRDGLVAAGVHALDVGGTPLTVWHRPGQTSALGAGDLTKAVDIGTVAVFESTLDGRELTFRSDGDVVRDVETGSSWNVFGRATRGELAGTELVAVEHLDTFWFSWSAFQQDTTISEP